MVAIAEILLDLRAEYERLDGILASLSDAQWATESGAPGWSVLDVVTHLTVSEEGVSVSMASQDAAGWTEWDGALDDAMAAMVQQNSADPATTLARWRSATSASLADLANGDPSTPIAWAAAPLRPATLATTRLAEHWAHGLDITEPLGLEFPDTDRLRHIAWLGHATIPYGCSLRNIEPEPIRATLTSPSGETWSFGPNDAPSTIVGSAADFCRIGAQRLKPEQSDLELSGPFAKTAAAVLRNYAA